MSYTPNTWKSGDVVTSAKLNNIERGISNAVQFVTVNVDMDSHAMVATETAADIWDEVQNGIVMFLLKANDTVIGCCLCISADTVTVNGGYAFAMYFAGGNTQLTAASGTDYPALS